MATKIDIISGFLGAGKTTLIKKLLKEAYADEQVVLIENEFGEIGIDGGFMKDAGINVTEMNSGCICCSLVGDFGAALEEVLEKYHPDRIIIEPSGVGKLSDVIKAVSGVMESHADVQMNGYVTVADATKCKMYMKNFGEFYNNQVESAKTIVLSRTGKITDEKLDAALALIREKNDKATIITTPWDEIDGKQILGAIEESNALELELMEEEDVCPECGHHHDHDHDESCGCHDHDHHHDHDEHDHHHHDHDHEHDHGESCTCGCHDHDHDHEHHHHHHADEVFTSWGMETAKTYTAEEIQTALEQLEDAEKYGMILRAKGIVAGADGKWIHFDYVPGTPDVRTGSASTTGRLCVIGSHIQEDALAALFRTC